MNLQEKTITCFDCGVTYSFSVEEQEAFHAKGHNNAPKRCPSCRQARKTRQLNGGNNGNNRSPQLGFRSERKMFSATCARCGRQTQLPFEPKEGRPVYCRDCYNTARASQ